MHLNLMSLKIGETALYWAAKEGRLRVVEILLDRGADIEARDNTVCKAHYQVRTSHIVCP